MRFVILLGVLCSALLVGCGNRDDQRFYEDWEAELEKAEKAEKALSAKMKSAIYRYYGGRSYCPKCPHLDIMSWDIDRIELEKTGYDGIWGAKVYVNCPLHGYIVGALSEWYVSDDSMKRVK